MDELLQSLGFQYKYSELTPEEKRTAEKWLQDLQVRQLTIQDVKDYIGVMKSAVEDELSKPDLTKEQDLFLKARMKNYILLEAFLTSPERAKKAYESQLKNMKK